MRRGRPRSIILGLMTVVLCGAGVNIARAQIRTPAEYVGDAQYRACLDREDTSVNDWATRIECGNQLVVREEARLAQVWKSVYAEMDADSGDKKNLLSDQRLWIAYKDKACAFYAGASGSMYRGLAQLCVAEIITHRIDYLNDIGADYQ